jgi:hypothetical protein
VRERAEVEIENARLRHELELERALKIQPAPLTPKRESEARGLRLDVRDPVSLVKALAGLLVAAGVGFGGSEIHKQVTAKPEQPPVAPVAAAQSALEARIAGLERCIAAREKVDAEDDAFLEEALAQVGVVMPRRPHSDPPRRIDFSAQPLINPRSGQKLKVTVASERPERVKCP